MIWEHNEFTLTGSSVPAYNDDLVPTKGATMITSNKAWENKKLLSFGTEAEEHRVFSDSSSLDKKEWKTALTLFALMLLLLYDSSGKW